MNENEYDRQRVCEEWLVTRFPQWLANEPELLEATIQFYENWQVEMGMVEILPLRELVPIWLNPPEKPKSKGRKGKTNEK